MNCEILNVLYIKANGEILCHDDFGERISLGWVRPEEGFSIHDVFQGEKHQHIRRSFAAGQVPWDGICQNCAFFRPLQDFVDGPVGKSLRMIQVESSLACPLACPACAQSSQIVQRPKPHILPFEVFDALVTSCANEGYTPGALEYCGQGEPLLNPKFRQMVARSRTLLPHTRHRVITSGNVPYAKTIAGEHVEELYVSCDGLRQENYERYRINGKVEKALSFMRDAKAADPRSTVVWKYILFEFNDSDEEILAAQRRADELGVDVLLFVYTHSMFKSARYTPDNLHTLPIVSPIARTSVTPIQKKLERPGASLSQAFTPKVIFSIHPQNAGHCVVDEVILRGDEKITLRGWATDKDGGRLRAIEAFSNDHLLGSALLGQPRGDVLAAFPHFSTDRLGFYLASDLPAPGSPPTKSLTLHLKLHSETGQIDLFRADYQFS